MDSSFGFCGPFYTSASPNVDAEACINRFIERIEAEGKSPLSLRPMPGTAIFQTLNEPNIPGQKYVPAQGRYFVAGSSLWEITSNGTVTNRGPLAPSPTQPVQMEVNPTQLLICSGGLLWTFTFATNVLAPVGSPPFANVGLIGWSDGFFVAVQLSPADIALSAIGDGTSWNAINTSTISLFPDNIVSMQVDHRELALLGNTRSVVYANAGAAIFPFQPVPGAYIEAGSAAQFAVSKLDNSVFAILADERGFGVAFRSQQYNFVRISNHAVEHQWQSYATISDAESFTMQMDGHPWWVIYFPTADITWVYDVSTQAWFNWLSWENGQYHAHHARNHQVAFGRHLVGDRASGTILQVSMPVYNQATGQWLFCTDAGNPIRRLRRAPYIQARGKRMFHKRIQFDIEAGLGPMPPLTAPGPATNANFPDEIILQAPDSSLWAVTVDDNGGLFTTSVVSGTPTTVVLNDPADASFSWKLIVATGGILKTQSTAYQPSTATSFPINSEISSIPWSLNVTNDGAHFGLLQTTSLPISSTEIARDPQIMLRWSDTNGKTWSNEYLLNCGQSGDFLKRVYKPRLGSTLHGRIYEVTDSDPVPITFADAYLDVG